ncbi:MAG: hypothetical protein HY659_11845 [Rhizobiales bacterium]|nr:hypothetical protein [Hyphomicrobiales bacterium]
MRRFAFTATSLFIAVISSFPAAQAADLEWSVENPFRFFKPTGSFALHERAYAAVRGNPAGAAPADIIARVERRLNDPDCKDASTPDTCAATKRANYDRSRLGWAAQTIGAVCYDSAGRPPRYPAQCERRYSWGAAKEDYVLPEAHTVNIALSAAPLAAAGAGECAWTWQPRSGGPAQSKKQPCKTPLTITRVPFSLDRAKSGVAVNVRLPDGQQLSEPDVIVEDIFLVALGDSFASGESNPDRPVTFSPSREMVYDPVNTREELATRSLKAQPNYGIASTGEKLDPKSLPKRLMDDEAQGQILRPTSREFLTAFEKRGARWLSADCHRSQYGYPFRVGIQLTLENRHRAVTFVSLACSGAEIAEGLFMPKDAREGFVNGQPTKVPAQLDQLSDLICRGGVAGRSAAASYSLPLYRPGSPAVQTSPVAMRWCPQQSRKRPIDLVLMSIGGNDVGFSALAAYTMTENAADLAPIVGWIGHEIRFGPNISRAYLSVLDARMKAVKDALRDGFGVEPARVVQTAYEPIQFDETGALCGTQPTLGMDVHPKLRLSRARVQETESFLRDFLVRLECISDVKRRADCPAGLKTGAGTGFNLVTAHQAKFARRGICARDPARAAIDGVMMTMPRMSRLADAFKPYSPANELPYAHRWRLFRTPNDAFLIANTHREGISPFDILQPAYAGLYSGAIHPSAEAHSIVADHVMPYARSVLSKGKITVTAR